MMKGLGALGDIGKMMAQAKEMQAKFTELQARLETIEVEGKSGAGMVVATCSAKGRLVRLSIDPSLSLDAERGVVEDLIVAAVNDAQEKAQERAQSEMAELTGGLGMPPGFAPGA